jgi:hypothetical protein
MTGNNVGKSLNQILGSTQNDVAKMKGWFAWAYNHGGLGGGTGGSGTTDTNNFNISIQLDGDTISNTGGILIDDGIVYDGRKLTDNSPLLTKGITKKIKTTKKERSDDQIHNDNFIKDNTIRRFKCRILRKRNILV